MGQLKTAEQCAEQELHPLTCGPVVEKGYSESYRTRNSSFDPSSISDRLEPASTIGA